MQQNELKTKGEIEQDELRKKLASEGFGSPLSMKRGKEPGTTPSPDGSTAVAMRDLAMVAQELNYTQDFNRLQKYLDAHGEQLHADSLLAFFKDLDTARREDGSLTKLSASTFNRYYSGIKKTVTVALERFYHGHVPMDVSGDMANLWNRVKRKKQNAVSVTDSKIITPEEALKFVAECRGSGQHQSIVISYVAELLWNSGLRIDEILSIELGDITAGQKRGQRTIRIRGKGRKQRDIEAPAKLLNEIKAYFKSKKYLFEHPPWLTHTRDPVTGEYTHEKKTYYSRVSVSARIKTLSIKYLGRPITAHNFRHGWAKRMLDQGQPIQLVSMALGHTSMNTTLKIYGHQSVPWSEMHKITALNLDGYVPEI